jgi:hypothetical protein
MTELSESELDDLIEQAIIDAHGDAEQMVGFYTMINDNLALPFTTTVLGVEAEAEVCAGSRPGPESPPQASPTNTSGATVSRIPCPAIEARAEPPHGSPQNAAAQRATARERT